MFASAWGVTGVATANLVTVAVTTVAMWAIQSRRTPVGRRGGAKPGVLPEAEEAEVAEADDDEVQDLLDALDGELRSSSNRWRTDREVSSALLGMPPLGGLPVGIQGRLRCGGPRELLRPPEAFGSEPAPSASADVEHRSGDRARVVRICEDVPHLPPPQASS